PVWPGAVDRLVVEVEDFGRRLGGAVGRAFARGARLGGGLAVCLSDSGLGGGLAALGGAWLSRRFGRLCHPSEFRAGGPGLEAAAAARVWANRARTAHRQPPVRVRTAAATGRGGAQTARHHQRGNA